MNTVYERMVIYGGYRAAQTGVSALRAQVDTAPEYGEDLPEVQEPLLGQGTGKEEHGMAEQIISITLTEMPKCGCEKGGILLPVMDFAKEGQPYVKGWFCPSCNTSWLIRSGTMYVESINPAVGGFHARGGD